MIPGFAMMCSPTVAGGGGGATDPYWANVVSLLHFDGADGSTTFTDEKGKVWTPAGNAQIDTAQSKFGGASGLLDGSGDYIKSVTHADWAMGTGNFTIECWVRQAAAATSGDRTLFCATLPGGVSMGLQNGKLFCGAAAVSYGPVAASAITADTWTHVAACRASGTMRVFQGGVAMASASDTYNYVQGLVDIGAGSVDGNTSITSYYSGHIEELRITKGVARYISNFTPPAAPFPNS